MKEIIILYNNKVKGDNKVFLLVYILLVLIIIVILYLLFEYHLMFYNFIKVIYNIKNIMNIVYNYSINSFTLKSLQSFGKKDDLYVGRFCILISSSIVYKLNSFYNCFSI